MLTIARNPRWTRVRTLQTRGVTLSIFAVVVALIAILPHGSSPVVRSATVSPTAALGLTNLGVVYYVDNDTGNDHYDCLAPAIASGPPTAGQVDGPCKTIQHAISLTRDRDLVIVASQEPIQLSGTIEVPDLIGVVATGEVPTQCQDLTGTSHCSHDPCQDVAGGSSIVLESAGGAPIFHVTATGSPSLHALIAGFIMGGTTSFSNPGAITLDHDAFTEVRCNIIGQEDLPNVIGILTNSSEHPLIHDNIIHGSSQFPISATLGPAPPLGGLGLVTGECLGSSSRTDQLDVERNLFAFNSNAGIWICSDGSGGHLLEGNNIRSNGRGIVLLSAVDTTLKDNFIGDNYYDGVDILDASQNNLLDSNQIESQEGPSSTGVLLQGSGLIFPLGNTLNANQIRRNRVDVLIAGARGTKLTGNSLTAIGERTAVLIAIGNDSGAGDADFGQPDNTTFRSNKLYDDGVCEALRGCAIRLLPGVTSTIDADGNDFGVTDPAALQAVIWDGGRDPELGTVLFAATAPATPVASRKATRARVVVTVTPFSLLPTTQVTPSPVATAALATSTPMPTPTLAASATPSPAAASPTPAGPGPAPVAYVDPASGNYYVEVSLCVSDPSGQPVAGDLIGLSFFDAVGNALGLSHVHADASGCFLGDVQVAGAGAAVQPASISLSDASGASTTLQVALGAPLTRPPSSPLQSGS